MQILSLKDGVPEILAVHGGDELSDPALEEKMFGRLIIFDGQNGNLIKWMQTPDRRESYYPPQILESPSGELKVLYRVDHMFPPDIIYRKTSNKVHGHYRYFLFFLCGDN